MDITALFTDHGGHIKLLFREPVPFFLPPVMA